MKKHTHRICVHLLALLSLLLTLAASHARQMVELASIERIPYIGANLPNRGYVAEVVTEAFRRTGYDVTIKFYPLARAKFAAEQGVVDGWIPAPYQKDLEKIFSYSRPFPGDEIGLLKKRSMPARYASDPQKNMTAAFRELRQHRFGFVRGADSIPGLDDFQLLKDEVSDDLVNIDMLAGGRVHFAVIDKYTAADLMTTQRPNLIGQLEFMSPPLVSNSFHLAFSRASKGYQQRQAAFDKGLQALIADGTLEKIRSRHGLAQFAPGKADKIKLTIGTVDNGDMIVMKSLSEQFEKSHPGIKLEWKILDESTLRQRLLSDLAISDGQFDIMTIGAYEAPIWAKQGWLTPLQGLPDDYEVNDILGSVREGLSYQQRLYALPFYAESSMTFYRKDLFRKAGLTMPAQPTYADIKKFAAAIHDPSRQIYGICLRGKAGWGENMALLGTMANTFGGRWFDEQWRPTINTPEWKKAVTVYKELLTQYGPPQASANGFNANLSLFSNGHCGMWIDATVAAGMLFNPAQSKVHDRLGFAPAPIGVTPKGAHWLWTWALAIPDSSKHKQEALQFVTWATSQNYIREVARKKGWVAAPPGTRRSTYANADYQAAAPFADFVLNAIQNADPINSTLKPKPYTGIQIVGIPEFSAIGGRVGEKIAKVIEGAMTVDQALQDSQAFAEEQMKRSGYYK